MGQPSAMPARRSISPATTHEIVLGDFGSCAYCAEQTPGFCEACHRYVCQKPDCHAQHDREWNRSSVLSRPQASPRKEVDFERRRPLRTAVQGIEVDYPDLQPQLRDLSPFGVYIEDGRPPSSAGTSLRIRIWLSETECISARVIVRRVDPGGMAVEFTEISSTDRARLEAFLHTLNKH